MKKLLSSLLAATVILSTAGTSFATQTTTGGYVDDRGDSYELANGEKAFATKVIDFVPGDPRTKKEGYLDPQTILGPSDGNGFDANTSVNLGSYGSITLEFQVWFCDGDGVDIWVFEVGSDVEATTVEVSQDGINWIMIGECRGATSAVDMTGKVEPGMYFRYVRITDADASYSNYPGADIDAVAVIHNVIEAPIQRYGINLTEMPNGTAFTDKTSAEEGERVLVAVGPNTDYMLKKLQVLDQYGREISVGYDWNEGVYAFIMPDCPVTITPHFVEISDEFFPIDQEYSEGGSFTLSNDNPQEAEEVTITTNPNSGYSVSFVTVTNNATGERIQCNNKGNGTYSFRQPSSSVTVKVTYQNVKNTTDSYTDVAVDDWFTAFVAYVTENGYMSGIKEGVFAPDAATTRGMVALILALASGDDIPEATQQEFNDVPLGQWYSNGIAWCKEQGVVAGYTNGNFGVDDPITKEQMVLMMQGFAKYQGLNTDHSDLSLLLSYVDGQDVAAWAAPSFAWALAEGYIQSEGNELLPQSNASRAEFANILNLFLENS